MFPPAAIWAGLRAQGIVFPSNYTYENLGTVKSKGLEFGVDGELTSRVAGFATYTYQAEPIPEFEGKTPEEALAEINLPSTHQFTLGVNGTTDRMFGTLAVTHQTRAFWQDVLDARYHGYTPANTSVNLTVGTTWQDGRYSVALKTTNLLNSDIQQHIFGDILRRLIMVEFKMSPR